MAAFYTVEIKSEADVATLGRAHDAFRTCEVLGPNFGVISVASKLEVHNRLTNKVIILNHRLICKGVKTVYV